MNQLWAGFFLIAFFFAGYQGFFLGNYAVFSDVLNSLFDMSKVAVEICIGLIGLLTLWMGFMKIAERSGIIDKLSQLLSPLFSVLMPDVPRGHPAIGSVTMNMTANALGLDNAATPMGLKAMKDLQTLNTTPHVATNAQILFLVINTSSVTLFPVTIFLYRAQQGAVNPADVFIPILLSTAASTFSGLLAVSFVQKLNLLNRVFIFWSLGFFVLIISLLLWVSGMTATQLNDFSSLTGNLALLSLIMLFILIGLYKKIPVYDCFIEGAKQGISVSIRIIPYLLGMLIAIGVLRASGALDALTTAIRGIVEFLGGDTRFVDALPTAMMKPFSGAGSRAMMLDTMSTHGVDSFAGRLSAMFQGSTETTFYVLAVYFGSVGIRNSRHAIACGLIADFAGLFTAVMLAYYFYG